jgi:hypothetical protein
MKKRHLILAATLTGALAIAGTLTTRATAAPPATANYREATWDELVPKDWDPTKRFRNSKLGMFSDADPRVLQMMREMRETWDNAPTNSAMDGAAVKLPGYVVPLDETKAGIKEFLLVPYFGACIHTPPPPANQIIHVIAAKPAKGLHMMDAVWVSGTLKTFRGDSVMGVSGYQMQAAQIDPYEPPKK